jgi:hypothetical protein
MRRRHDHHLHVFRVEHPRQGCEGAHTELPCRELTPRIVARGDRAKLEAWDGREQRWVNDGSRVTVTHDADIDRI